MNPTFFWVFFTTLMPVGSLRAKALNLMHNLISHFTVYCMLDPVIVKTIMTKPILLFISMQFLLRSLPLLPRCVIVFCFFFVVVFFSFSAA